uniref:Uncharacterized protein n=1 Tax=Anguilla anguilla TaxID=7936 RepID=A0A0E9QVR8_ANGAN
MTKSRQTGAMLASLYSAACKCVQTPAQLQSLSS